MAPATDPEKPPAGPVRLLALDGGGVKGVSSLMILKAIMDRVNQLETKKGSNDRSERLPVSYFHLAGGTSTGGLAALMMFRLNLSTTQTIENYDSMSKKIFSPSLGPMNLGNMGRPGYYLGNFVLKLKAVFLPAMFSAKPLERAIDQVVTDCGISDGGKAPLLDNSKGKMFMCSTLAEKGEAILFRSYHSPEDSAPVSSGVRDMSFSNVTISEAARATSAAPAYLPEMIINTFKFWDGGLLNNNPIDQVWDARYDLAPSTKVTPQVSCILSIGTSWSVSKPISSTFFKRFANVISQTISFATNTEAKHRDFERKVQRMNARLPDDEQISYFRFNVPTDKETFNLDDWQSMGRLKALTTKYIEQEASKIEACARALMK